MSHRAERITDLKILIGIGLFVMAILIGGSFLLHRSILSRRGMMQPQPLGAQGSVCGGAERLPCAPGFRCAMSAGATQGICVESSVQESERVRKANEACGVSVGWCDVGLVCKSSTAGSSGVCLEADEKSASVLKLTLDGMSHDGTMYVAAPGSVVRVTVQAVNAVSASLHGGSSSSPLSLNLTRDKAGVFTGQFTVLPGLSGDLWVRVTDDRGQVSAMSVKVSSE
jgi:hypothetical protein